jgi:hypothetical protein
MSDARRQITEIDQRLERTGVSILLAKSLKIKGEMAFPDEKLVSRSRSPPPAFCFGPTADRIAHERLIANAVHLR